MAVKIRLRRTGSRNAACFRVVATDARSPRDGRFIETLGWYDPKLKGVNFKLKLGRVEYWRSQGAEISDTVKSLLKRARNAGMTDAAVEPAAEPVAEPVAEPEAAADEAVVAATAEAPEEAEPVAAAE